MSVYVDRLPDECYCCVCNDDYWRCGISGESISHDGRREDCPLKEIVRCKDCEFCIVEEPISRGIIPDVYCRIWQSNVSTDDYCSYGEKQVTGKLESVEKATSEGKESTTGQPKSKLESDVISRQAAIEAMWKALYSYEDLTEKQFMEHEELELEDWYQHRIFVQRMHEECMKSVEMLPPVEPKRPKGEWIESYFNEWCGTDENHNSVFRKIPCVKCDQCGEKRRSKEKFCPNCGADMRGDKE